MNGLGIDAGGSETRWRLVDPAGHAFLAGALEAVNGHLFLPEARAAFETFARDLRDALGGHAVGGIVAGITGLTGDSAEAARARAILSATLSVPPDAIEVQDDLWIGYRAVFAPGEGHVVYAGTGSVGMHIGVDGATLRVGGRGILIDDGGSAFWIGRQALNAVYRDADEGRDPGLLAAALYADIGGTSWNDVRAHVYGGGRTAVAMLARAVARAAESGDHAAHSILRNAGGELARLAVALVHRRGALPVVVLGRAAGLHPAILEGFRAAAPGLDPRLEWPDAALAAARLALAGCRPG